METCRTCEHWLRITHWGVCRRIKSIDNWLQEDPLEVNALVLGGGLPGEAHAFSCAPDFGCVLWKEREIPYD